MDISKLEERFTKKIYICPDDGCWIWTAYKCRKGYGIYTVHTGKTSKAHRYAYEQLVGPIPEGLVLDHFRLNPGPWRRCSKACVNPAHLEAVTAAENTRRADWSAGGDHERRKTHCIRGHEFTEENTTIRTSRGWTERGCRACLRLRKTRAYLDSRP